MANHLDFAENGRRQHHDDKDFPRRVRAVPALWALIHTTEINHEDRKDLKEIYFVLLFFEVFEVRSLRKLSGTLSSHHAHMPGGRAAPIPEIIHFPVNQNLKIPE
jgi:hypothetical protein